MASTRTRQSMVFLKEGARAPVEAPTADHHPPVRFSPLRPDKIKKGRTVQNTHESSDKIDVCIRHTTTKAKEANMKMGEKHSSSLSNNSENLSPDSVCKGIKVTLDNNSMWNEFFRCRTEMILTEQGSRMFPYCRFHICGLQPHRKYSLIMDIQPLDNSQYRWTGESWQVSRKAECHIKRKPFVHPESPATGQYWMKSPVSFYKLKLTNNVLDQEGNIILHPLHRYLPRLHVVEVDKATEDIRLNGPNVLTFSFLQTEFMTVTTYQNPQFAQLKVNYNPFAKGLKEDGLNSLGLKLKANTGKDSKKDGADAVSEQHHVKKNLKFLLANHKPKCSKAGNSKISKDSQKNSSKNCDPCAAVVPEGIPSSSSRPAQKLISELICEAHVSLQKCSVEQSGGDHSSSLRAAQSNDKPTNLAEGKKRGAGLREPGSTPQRKGPTGKTLRKHKDDEHCLNMRGSCCSAATSGKGPDSSKLISDARSDSVTQQKRPARLPLPALALFLKRHSTNFKKTNSKTNSPPPESEDCDMAPRQEARNTTGFCCASPSKVFLDVFEQAGETLEPSPSPSNLSSVTASESVETNLDDPPASISEGLALKAHDDQPMTANLQDSFSAPSVSTCATSSEASHLAPISTVLCAPNSHKVAAEPSETLKCQPLLFDSECSSFDFGPLSPASSPEPLPSLPSCLGLEMDSASSVAATATESVQDSKHSESSSVFKWHTVLPPSETYAPSSFTFQSSQQVPLLMSSIPPLLSSPPQPLSLNTTPTSPIEDNSPPSFQETEPFPAELSPLTLQLSLSPTFSSLDENGLSPTPSLTDLVHFFSNDVDIGMEVEFSNAETIPAPCPPPPVAETQETSPQVQPVTVTKPWKRKKTSKSTKLARLDMDQRMDDYRSKQPNLDEVEEQLFVSFKSKEALRLHIADSCDDLSYRPQVTPEGKRTAEEPENRSNAESLEETIAGFQKILLKDLDLMKYRQVIHPELQEVGLKMTLLDPNLSIDLQYLGVRLPIPPPGSDVEPPTRTLPSPQGASAAFLSRTGKTTDVTQIKGWREKFTPSKPAPISESGPEGAPGPQLSAGPSSDLPKRNLSAFCSDMLDEYLENEGKLIDERAASFSQLPVETPLYQLPESSTSYVRTLDHILKKQISPTSDLISGFVPPSKRPRLKETKTCGKAEKKLRFKQKRAKPIPPESTPAAPKQYAAQAPDGLSQTTPPPDLSPFKRRKLKPTTSSQTLSHSAASVLDVSGDMAPVESDSELGQTSEPNVDACKKQRRPMMTRALLRQKDLEDGVVWEGSYRTSVTEERASVALTSLFTLTGFVSENPTAPVKLTKRRAFPCLNEFCRLGCVCSSLCHSLRISHCGRPSCMFGCNCLKQKVVLLKNLDSSDSSPPSHHGKVKKRKKKKKRRRMKMAYILKEADSVTQPAKRVHTLWRRNIVEADPEPVYVPVMTPSRSCPAVPVKTPSRSCSAVGRKIHSSCARVRCYRGKRCKQKEPLKDTKPAKRKVLKPQVPASKRTETPSPHSAVQVVLKPPENPPEESISKPSKRLIVMANCKWDSDADRSQVLKRLCELMARDQLIQPLWIKKYFIRPLDETVEGSGANRCIQYKVQISTPNKKLKNAAKPENQKNIDPAAQHRQNHHLNRVPNEEGSPRSRKREKPEPMKEWQNDVIEEAEPVEEWQREVVEEEEEPVEEWQKEVIEEEEEPVEEWQREVIKDTEAFQDPQKEVKVKPDPVEETEPLEEWQKEVEESDIEEEKDCHSNNRAEDGEERSADEMKLEEKASLALPFLTGVTPAGFLSANRKQPGGTDHVIQVNGKLYPLARIQLGRMGALHPANRLAAYLTGRVGSKRLKAASLSFVASKASAGPAASAPTVTTAPPIPPVAQHTYITPLTAPQPKRLVIQPSALPLGSGPSKDSALLLVHVPSKTYSHVPQKLPTSTISSQQMVLQPVQIPSGAQYYRKPDGKLIQLIPINQLRPIKSTVQGGPTPSPSLLLSAPSAQVSAVTTTVKRPILAPSLSSSSLSSSSSSSSSTTLLTPLHFPSKFQKPNPSMNFIQVTLPPTQGGAALDRPSLPQDLNKEIRPPEGAVVQHTPASPQIHTPSETPIHRELPPPLAPPPSESLDPEDALACDPVDLDIICVDDETEDFTMGMKPIEVVDLVSSSEAETETSSDFRESDIEDEKQQTADRTRHFHNMNERKRRDVLRCMFRNLQKEVLPSQENMSKVFTLQKATDLIEELRSTEKALKRRKMRLQRRRNRYLSILAPSADQSHSVSVEEVDLLNELIEISSDQEKRLRAKSTRTSFTDAPLEVQVLQGDKETKNLKILSSYSKCKRDAHIDPSGLENLQHSPTKLGMEDKHQVAGGGASVVPSPSSPEPQPATKPSPSGVLEPSNPGAVKTPVGLNLPSQFIPQILNTVINQSNVTHNAPEWMKRPRTVPNILSRSKNPSAVMSRNKKPPEGPNGPLVPAEVLSLVGKVLPGQPVLTLSPVIVGTTVLQAAPPGVNISSLSRQEIPVTSLVHSRATPLSITKLTDLSSSVHPPLQTQPAGPLKSHQRDGQLVPSDSSHLLISADSNLIRNQELGLTQTLRPASSQSPGLHTSGPAPQQVLGSRTLNRNQQPAAPAVPAPLELSVVGDTVEQRHAPWSEDARLNSVPENSQGSGPPAEHTNGGALAPPPLLHMKAGQAKSVDLPSSNRGAEEGDSGGATWRPMPRLVPLGLRGNSPS